MATLKSLKQALKKKAKDTADLRQQPLSDTQYDIGFDILVRDSEWLTYQEFIIPQLSELLSSLFPFHDHLSVLEVGPGPKSVLGYLPDGLRRKIRKYTAFEPNSLYAERLEEWLRSDSEIKPPFGSPENPPKIQIHRTSFIPHRTKSHELESNNEKYDIILFCHSMYGMSPKRKFIERALEMLVDLPEISMVVVFHRDAALRLEGLVCHRTVTFPTGVIRVPDKDDILDTFAAFIAGFTVDQTTQVEWRKECRALGRREETCSGCLSFRSPNAMVTFNQHATALPELMAQVPLSEAYQVIKNREARMHDPASIMRPTEVQHIQHCVRWALKCGASLTILGGSHSGQCLWPNVVAVDMGAFDKVHLLLVERNEEGWLSDPESLVIAEAGCKMGDIVQKTMAAGLTVPLGARPSVGAGLWLQGGIGHLTRRHGLACDAIIGAVIVSVKSGQVFYVGNVPDQHRPVGAIRPANESELLWTIKGAGTNFGIVMSVVFKTYAAPSYSTRNWIFPLRNSLDAQLTLNKFDQVARKLSRHCSADAYLYWDAGQLHVGVTLFESSATGPTFRAASAVSCADWGPANTVKIVNGVELFDTEMYVSGMHGGHGSGKTSSFKRCLFLSDIGDLNIASHLVEAVESRPSSLCYLHLLQGGGALNDVAADATAFGCRDWDFACVITGVWPRDQDNTAIAWSAVQWVYSVAQNLLPWSTGAYGADLGPDPRDAALATKAFGPNLPRLSRLKHSLDPRNVLAYACPTPRTLLQDKLIILVTGESCAGKDFCAEVWVSEIVDKDKGLTARVVSISEAIKREYAAAKNINLRRLLQDRSYKEQHRPALTEFFMGELKRRPHLLEETFLSVVCDAADVDVLIITGMRDEAPVATFQPLVPRSRLLEIHVQASEQTRQRRRGACSSHSDAQDIRDHQIGYTKALPLDYRPTITFINDEFGSEAAKTFAKRYLLPFFHEDLQRLASMVRLVPAFPRLGINFRHVLGISQQQGGLSLCTSLLQTRFTGDWTKIQAVVSCEVGGIIYASTLAAQVDLPLVLIRESGKLPPPTISVLKPSSNISSLSSKHDKEKRIEMEQGILQRGSSVVVVDDVLSTGETLCAVLELLFGAGINAEDVSIMIVAEFPIHRGRNLLRQRGFGGSHIQSLLVFDGD